MYYTSVQAKYLCIVALFEILEVREPLEYLHALRNIHKDTKALYVQEIRASWEVFVRRKGAIYTLDFYVKNVRVICNLI